MRKRTADDDAFVVSFASELRREYGKAKRNGVSDQAFAESIGVERPQLNRYLDGESMPSVRTVVLAYQEYAIAIPYRRVSLQRALPKKGRRKEQDRLAQLVLPFTIQTERAAARVGLKLSPVSARRFELRLTVEEAG
jgi:transcriptional regulator with XRE-family HTH domain